MNDQKLNDIPFQATTAGLAKGNALGDSETLSYLLSFTITEFIAGKPAKALARRLASILLGEDSDYVAMHRWNEPGGIDLVVKQAINSTETEPAKIVEHAVVKMFVELAKVGEHAVKEDLAKEQIEPMLDEITKWYLDLFLGNTIANRAMMLAE